MSEKKKVLVVDDEARMRKLIGDFLVSAGFDYIEAEDGEDALKKFYADKNIELVILDVMMPKLDGWETLKAIKKESSVPCIMLTAKTEEQDEITSFKNGADDYIQKPFSPKVLIARVNAVLKRNTVESKTLVEGGIKLDNQAHQAFVDDKEIELSYKEYELLEFLMENKNIALTREKILNSVWNFDFYGDARTIDTHIKKLRAKLGDKGEYIKTIWGMGYKFKVD